MRVPIGSAESKAGPYDRVIPRRITCRDMCKYDYGRVLSGAGRLRRQGSWGFYLSSIPPHVACILYPVFPCSTYPPAFNPPHFLRRHPSPTPPHVKPAAPKTHRTQKPAAPKTRRVSLSVFICNRRGLSGAGCPLRQASWGC